MGGEKEEEKGPGLRDFLGMGGGGGRVVGKGDVSGGFRLVSGTSDLGSGQKRSNSDSTFMEPVANRMHSVRSDSLEYLRLKKMHELEAPHVRQRRSYDGELMLSMKPVHGQASTSFVLQSPLSNRSDTHVSIWEQTMPVETGQKINRCSRFSQDGVIVDKVSCHSHKENRAGGIVSQTAADEGSRTGMKGAGILNMVSCNPVCNSTGALPSKTKHTNNSYGVTPESSILPSHNGTASVGRQMTIFYDGQAHVFEDVQPNKADVIMALAGSNGGSWTTSYGKSVARSHINEAKGPSREKETSYGNLLFSQDAVPGNAIQVNIIPSQSPRVPGSGDFLNWTSGVHEGSRPGINMQPTMLTDPNCEAKRKS